MQQTHLFNLCKFYPNNKAAQKHVQLFKIEPLFFFFFLLWGKLNSWSPCFHAPSHANKAFPVLPWLLACQFHCQSCQQTDRKGPGRPDLSLLLLRPLKGQQCGEIPAHEQRSKTVPLLCKIRCSLVWGRRGRNKDRRLATHPGQQTDIRNSSTSHSCTWL